MSTNPVKKACFAIQYASSDSDSDNDENSLRISARKLKSSSLSTQEMRRHCTALRSVAIVDAPPLFNQPMRRVQFSKQSPSLGKVAEEFLESVVSQGLHHKVNPFVGTLVEVGMQTIHSEEDTIRNKVVDAGVGVGAFLVLSSFVRPMVAASLIATCGMFATHEEQAKCRKNVIAREDFFIPSIDGTTVDDIEAISRTMQAVHHLLHTARKSVVSEIKAVLDLPPDLVLQAITSGAVRPYLQDDGGCREENN